MKLLTVAVNMSHMSVPNKINRAREIANAIATHPTTFTAPVPTMAVFNGAINALELAWNDAAGGGKTKTTIMHDKERIMYKYMKDLAHYVEMIANGDADIVHLSSFALKAPPQRVKPDFEVFLPDDLGAVGLRCKARKKTLYRWEYCQSPSADNWLTGNVTDVAGSFIGNLNSGLQYWFRVVLCSASGEHPLSPLTIVPL